MRKRPGTGGRAPPSSDTPAAGRRQGPPRSTRRSPWERGLGGGRSWKLSVWGPCRTLPKRRCVPRGRGRLAVGAVGWLPFRVVGSSGGFVRGEGGICPALRARSARSARKKWFASQHGHSRETRLAFFGVGKPFAVCCVGLLRCEKGGIAAALLGAVAETAGIRSGGEGGD